ncbi:MAG: hypothetical protein ABIZ05_09215 [Pseudonocardiaceae bacterium]
MSMPAKGLKQPGVIVYLTRNTAERRAYLQTSLYFLFRNFNGRFQYPVHIFHEGDYDLASQELVKAGVRGGLGRLLQFRQVDPEDFRVPVELDEQTVALHASLVPVARGIRYRLMCRWWLVHLPRYVTEFEYYMRLDDDSVIEERLAADLFEVAARYDLDFASNLIHLEHPLNAFGLEDFVRAALPQVWPRVSNVFIHRLGAPEMTGHQLSQLQRELPAPLRSAARDQGTMSAPIMFYNNFQVCRTSLWSTPLAVQLVEALERHGGVLYFRWGDAPLQSILALAGPDYQVGRLVFPYSKRYEREWGAYDNAGWHVMSQALRGAAGPDGLPTGGKRSGLAPYRESGSLTDFPAFCDYLHNCGLDRFLRVVYEQPAAVPQWREQQAESG